MNEPNLSYYEDAQAFDDFHRYTSYYSVSQRALVDALQARRGDLIVEFGSATGETTRAIARRYPQATVLGVDVRPSIVTEARRLSGQDYPNLEFVAHDMGQLDGLFPWRGRWPDVVCWLYAYHHLPDPLAVKQAHAQALAATSVQRVVIVDEIIWVAATSPEYPEATVRQWQSVAAEAYRSVRINRYLALLNQGMESARALELAEQAAERTRDIELTIGQTTARRDDEYPVSREEMHAIWGPAGFALEFEAEVNPGLDWLFIWQRGPAKP